MSNWTSGLPRFNEVIGVVEATSFEKHCLWQNHNGSWHEGRIGEMVIVGRMSRRPVCISLSIDVVDGFPILFVEATSQVVDYLMIDKWLLEHLPKTARHPYRGNGDEYLNKVDAMNFHNIFP